MNEHSSSSISLPNSMSSHETIGTNANTRFENHADMAGVVTIRKGGTMETTEPVDVKTEGTAMEAFKAPITLVELCEELSCPICHEQLNKPTTVVDCLHNFCSDCIKNWLGNNIICPMCRLPIRALRANPTLNSLLEKVAATSKKYNIPNPLNKNEVVSTGPDLSAALWVACDSCEKRIEYELHFHCASCDNGNYDICFACYKSGVRCQDPSSKLPSRHLLHTQTFENGWQARKWDKDTGALEVGVFCSRCQKWCNSNFSNALWFYACDKCTEIPTMPRLQLRGIVPRSQATHGNTLPITKIFYCHDCILVGNHCEHALEKVDLYIPDRYPGFSMMDLEPFMYSAENYGWMAPEEVLSMFRTSACFYYCDSCSCAIEGPQIPAGSSSSVIPPQGTIYYHCTQCLGSDFDLCRPCFMKLNGITNVLAMEMMRLRIGEFENGLKCSAGHNISTMLITAEGRRQRLAR